MFSPRHVKHGETFHGDDALHDQTPATTSLLSSLPSGAAAIGHLLVHGKGEESKRSAIAQLPLNHPLSKKFLAKGVRHYWDSMLHPPLSYRGDTFQYRSADGADNNIFHPQLGKAGLPYAKSVPGKTGIHGARPDPGDLFDLLLARKDDTESKSGISSMLLYHATIIIHDTVRQHEYGLLKPDSFAERRLLLQPPGLCIYLLMYNRFHNYVAKQLLEINENGKFSLPFPEDSDSWVEMLQEQPEAGKAMKAKQDEDLFQTARLITCGMYINISIHDYLRVLMGFHAKDTPWTHDPRIEIPDDAGEKAGVLRGIVRFCEDRKWSEEFFKLYLKIFIGEGITEDQIATGEIPVPYLKEVIERGNDKRKTKEEKDKDLSEYGETKFLPGGLETVDFEVDGKGALKTDVRGKPVPVYKFKRNSEGYFDDAQLVAELVQVIEDPICQFGAQNVPKIFKAIEVLGILQARKWEVATLNEFREFFGLERHKHFEDINADKGISGALRDLYDDPHMVELYSGLVCEGAGRCLDPGTNGPHNIRSDRFYTLDWNVGSLKSWGMREVTSDPNILKGSVFHRLFQRAFPGYFKYNSIHLWQPFYTPAMNIVLANQQGYLSSLNLSDLEFVADLNLSHLDESKLKTELKKRNYEALKGKVHMDINALQTIKQAYKPTHVTKISDYTEIHDVILGKHKADFQNPGVLDKDMISGAYLRDKMTGGSTSFDGAAVVLQELVTPEGQTRLLEYFVGMSKEITTREQRSLQKVSRALGKKLANVEEVAAMMLVVALDCAQKHHVIHRVLEAQRIHVDLPLVRVYSLTRSNEPALQKLAKKYTLKKGDKILVQLKEAQRDPTVFAEPATLSLDPKKSDLKSYLIYGQDGPAKFDAKQLTLLALTGTIKYIATTRELRVAHDKLGRLKRAKTPYGVECYMTIQWDQLVQFPTRSPILD
ncbi:hypothetical protein MMC13_005351 [Lambiella insularis]|nr:hypothetical protein [Lambiella insularis]